MRKFYSHPPGESVSSLSQDQRVKDDIIVTESRVETADLPASTGMIGSLHEDSAGS
jgi:hypothetical protein